MWSLDQHELHHLGNLLEMQILSTHPRLQNQKLFYKTWNLCLDKPFREYLFKLESTALEYGGNDTLLSN